jgi:hypothetical protein
LQDSLINAVDVPFPFTFNSLLPQGSVRPSSVLAAGHL